MRQKRKEKKGKERKRKEKKRKEKKGKERKRKEKKGKERKRKEKKRNREAIIHKEIKGNIYIDCSQPIHNTPHVGSDETITPSIRSIHSNTMDVI